MSPAMSNCMFFWKKNDLLEENSVLVGFFFEHKMFLLSTMLGSCRFVPYTFWKQVATDDTKADLNIGENPGFGVHLFRAKSTTLNFGILGNYWDVSWNLGNGWQSQYGPIFW